MLCIDTSYLSRYITVDTIGLTPIGNVIVRGEIIRKSVTGNSSVVEINKAVPVLIMAVGLVFEHPL